MFAFGCGQRPQTMELNASVWRNLSAELLEQVLPFVPVPDLCRFRSVCKRWDSLIRTPDFGTLCVYNAATGVTNGACFVAKLRLCIDSTQTGKRCEEILSWSICDLSTKQWFNVKDELPKGYDYHVMAMDAGLVCAFGNALTDEQREASTVCSSITTVPQILMVSNLIEQSVKVLLNPPWPYINLGEANLQLVVDHITQDYRVFLIYVGDSWNSGDHCISVYSSSTNQWTISPYPPDPYPGGFGKHVCSVVYHGAVYVLFSTRKGPACRLFKYSFVEENWEDTGVIQRFWKFRKREGIMVHLCNLVVSDNRLFLMNQCMVNQAKVGNLMCLERPGQFAEKSNPWPLDISEVFLKQKFCVTVVQLTEKEVYQNFDIRMNDQKSFQIHAEGFDKSILLMTEKVHGGVGKYMLYNLVTKSWEFLPPNPVENLRFQTGYRGSMWRHGKHMNYLRLPNTPWG